MRHDDALSYVCDHYIAHSMITISDVQHYLPHISPAMNANVSFYGKELGSRGITSTCLGISSILVAATQLTIAI